jgi:hypothetical protein
MRLLTATVVAGIAVGCFCAEQGHRRYPTHAEAVAAGEVERGWLPRWVPPTATNIHLQRDLDTNEIWLRLSLPAASTSALRQALSPLSSEETVGISWNRPCGMAQWWPRNLVQLEPADDIALNAELFSADPNDSLYVAFDRTSDDVFVWERPTRLRHHKETVCRRPWAGRLTPRCSGQHPGIRPGVAAELIRR